MQMLAIFLAAARLPQGQDCVAWWMIGGVSALVDSASRPFCPSPPGTVSIAFRSRLRGVSEVRFRSAWDAETVSPCLGRVYLAYLVIFKDTNILRENVG